MIANRLEFRDGIATGRLLDPVVRPRGLFAGISGAGPDGRRAPESDWSATLVWRASKVLESAVVPPRGRSPIAGTADCLFRWRPPYRARSRFAGHCPGKHVMLIGVTGFIGKVWLVNTLMDLPEIGRIYLLIRRQKSNPAMRRFEKLVEESPVFDPLYARHGAGLSRFLAGTGGSDRGRRRPARPGSGA